MIHLKGTTWFNLIYKDTIKELLFQDEEKLASSSLPEKVLCETFIEDQTNYTSHFESCCPKWYLALKIYESEFKIKYLTM